jgi:hypothetical protein
MGLELGESEDKLLKHLISLGKNGGNLIEFPVRETLAKLNISRESFDDVLLSLEKKGYIKIVKVPPSEKLIGRLRKELIDMDGLFLMGELGGDDYLKQRKKVLDILTSVPDELEKINPLPPASIKDAMDSLRNAFDFLERLAEQKETLKPAAFSGLLNTYNMMIADSVSLLARYVEALSLLFDGCMVELEAIEREIEMLAADEKIRLVDLSSQKEERITKSEKIRDRLRRIADMLTEKGHGGEPSEAMPMEGLEDLQVKIDLLNARILIEGSTPELVEERKLLEKRLLQLESETRRERTKERAADVLDALLRELGWLQRSELLTERNRRQASETLEKLKGIYDKLQALQSTLSLS